MAEFLNTIAGKRFIEGTMPEMVVQLRRIADALESNSKEKEIGSSFNSVKTFVKQYPNDADLGEKIRQLWS